MSQPGSRFYNCRFEGNKSTETSLGYGNATGAIGLDGDLSNSFFQDKYLIIDGCEFVRNEGRTEAGAINARHNTKIYNSLFYQNSGENGGSGAVSTMARRAGEGANFETKLIIANCTFVENRCDFGPGAVFAYGGNGAIIFNSIFQNNFKQTVLAVVLKKIISGL